MAASPSEVSSSAQESAAAEEGTLPVDSTVTEHDFANPASSPQTLRLPTLRAASDIPLPVMTSSSTPLGNVNAARRPPPPPPNSSSVRPGALPAGMAAKMKAFHESRRGTPTLSAQPAGMPGGAIGGFPGSIAGTMPSPTLAGGPGLKLPTGGPMARPTSMSADSAPTVPTVANIRMPKIGGGLAAKRGLNRGMKLSDATGPSPESQPNGLTPSNYNNSNTQSGSMFNKYSEYVDTASGTLKFKGKATIHGSGIDFSSGTSFKISLDEVDTIDELGKGNYGTVYQVRHSRPRVRRPGLGLAGNKAHPSITPPNEPDSPQNNKNVQSTTGLIMAMKEIRLELDDAKFAQIIMELDILHRCVSPFIVDFYGAFFQEGAVYICMEFMDGGSIDKIYGEGIPENVLRKITLSTCMGLKSLKDDHNIIHRDVKPTNILVNSRGQIKICDFGVSGNLVASIAKTNIGCQSYMAPERIASGGVAQAGANNPGATYSVQSDIWSLGLSIIECAMGRYPYPPETYNNIFSQLSVRPSAKRLARTFEVC